MGDLIVTDRRNNMPVFSIIKTIISSQSDIKFLIDNLETIEFITYMSSYKLKENENMLKLIDFVDLKNAWPLDLYNFDDKYKLVSPKYPLDTPLN